MVRERARPLIVKSSYMYFIDTFFYVKIAESN